MRNHSMDEELLTEARVRALVPDRIFQRGDSYCEGGAILELADRGGVLHGLVAGSQEDPYAVEITTRGDRILARCDCPYAEDSGVWCKHIVAVMLALSRRRVLVGEQPTLHALLATLEPRALEGIIERLVEEAPWLYEAVRAMVEHGGAEEPGRRWTNGEGWAAE